MLLDAQVRTVRVRADDAERGGGRTVRFGRPGHQRAAADDVVPARFGRPGVRFRQPNEAGRIQELTHVSAYVER